MDARTRAQSIVRSTLGLADMALRASYLETLLRESDVDTLGDALDVLCERAEQAEPVAREVLISLVDAVHRLEPSDVVQRLREQSIGRGLLSLERLLRQPIFTANRQARSGVLSDPNQAAVPDYGRGRPLTLGERKSLARKPDRASLDRLLTDPHPHVIQMLLRNPRLTEDDVVRLAARRPCRPDVLTEIARSPKWLHRPRVRLAIVLNPDSPLSVSSPLVGLLIRQELKLVAESTKVPSAVRSLCNEHLERRPPGQFDEEKSDSGNCTLQ